MLALWLLALAPSWADVLHATLRVDGDQVEVVRAARLPGRAPDTPGDVAVLDAAGRVLATGALTRTPYRSVLTPDGHETARVDSPWVRVRLPWPDDAAALRVGASPTLLPLAPTLRRTLAVGAAEPVLQGGPPDTRLDLVFLAEGYTAERRHVFDAHVDEVLDHLLGIEPWRAYRGLFNAWRVFVPSVDPGADATQGLDLLDTAFECHYGCGLDGDATGRLICCDEAAVLDVVDAAAPFADGVMVLVDSAAYGGSGGQVYAATYTGDALALQVAAHELNHTLIGLWDEYDYGLPATSDERYAAPNCAPEDAPVPWRVWLDAPVEWFAWHRVRELARGQGDVACDGRPGADAPGAVCAYAGCSYTDWVRPTAQGCMMHALSDAYCPVCREAVVRRFYEALGGGLVRSADPPPGEPLVLEEDDEVIFTVDAAGPDAGLAWAWRSGGRVLHEGPDFTLRGSDRVCGDLTLTLSDPTPWVRRDPAGLLRQELSWPVRSERCCGCASSSPGAALAPLLLAAALVPRRRSR